MLYCYGTLTNQAVNDCGSCIVRGHTSRSPLCLCVCGWMGRGGGQHGAPFGSKATETFKNMVVHFVCVCLCVCMCVRVRCAELQRQTAPRLRGSSLLADPHLLLVRSRLSLHVSVIMPETVVLQLWKAEQLRGKKLKVTKNSRGLWFQIAHT